MFDVLSAWHEQEVQTNCRFCQGSRVWRPVFGRFRPPCQPSPKNCSPFFLGGGLLPWKRALRVPHPAGAVMHLSLYTLHLTLRC